MARTAIALLCAPLLVGVAVASPGEDALTEPPPPHKRHVLPAKRTLAPKHPRAARKATVLAQTSRPADAVVAPVRLAAPATAAEPEASLVVVAPIARRPRYVPYVTADVGVSVHGRSFHPDGAAAQPGFASTAVPGLRADLGLYPFAFSWRRARGVFSGLGVGVFIEKPFWAGSTTPAGARISTSELQLEAGLRWHVALYPRGPRPELLLDASYGLHQFSFGAEASGRLAEPPDVDYRYVAVGGGLGMRLAEWASIFATCDYHAILAAGEIATAAQYGRRHGGVALGLQGGVDFLPYRGLRIGARAYYDHVAMRFGDAGAQRPVTSALDRYYGGVLSVGYQL